MRRNRPFFILTIVLMLSVFNSIRLIDKYPVRPIVIVSLITVGMLFGALVFAFVFTRVQSARNKKQNPE